MRKNFQRAFAMVYRHIFYLKKPFEIFHYWYWILIDILIFGFLGRSYCQSASQSIATGSAACIGRTHVLFANLVLLYAFLRSTTTIGFAFLRDLWDANFVNLFATPLKRREWLLGLWVQSAICGLISFTIGVFLVWLIFDFFVFKFGWYILICLGLILCTGMLMGTLMTSGLLLLGKQANPLVWAIGWLFIPISGVYYSIDVLPPALKSITSFNPLYHIFSIIHAVGQGDTYILPLVLKSIGLLAVYAVCVALFFTYAFSVAKKRGLTRLEVEM